MYASYYFYHTQFLKHYLYHWHTLLSEIQIIASLPVSTQLRSNVYHPRTNIRASTQQPSSTSDISSASWSSGMILALGSSNTICERPRVRIPERPVYSFSVYFPCEVIIFSVSSRRSVWRDSPGSGYAWPRATEATYRQPELLLW